MKPYKEIKPLDERSQPVFHTSSGEKIQGRLIDEIETEGEYIQLDGRKTIYKYLVQQIEWDEPVEEQSQEEFRFCNYSNHLDKNGEPTRWVFQQNPPSVDRDGLKELVEQMQQKKWV